MNTWTWVSVEIVSVAAITKRPFSRCLWRDSAWGVHWHSHSLQLSLHFLPLLLPQRSPPALSCPLFVMGVGGGGGDTSNAEAEKWQVCFKIVVLWIMEKKTRHELWKWRVLFLFLETILMQVCQREETHGLLVLSDLWVPSYLTSYYFSSCPLGDPHSHPLQVYEEGVKIRWRERERLKGEQTSTLGILLGKWQTMINSYFPQDWSEFSLSLPREENRTLRGMCIHLTALVGTQSI